MVDEQRNPGFLATVSAVFGAFIGIRKRRDYERDAAQFKPAHLIIAGIIGGVIFVVSMVMFARFVVSQAG
ncbi:MAG: DUF2970 domain-containing protein [Rhodocyclaceae bacterium]